MYPETVLKLLLSCETAILTVCVLVHYLTLLSIA